MTQPPRDCATEPVASRGQTSRWVWVAEDDADMRCILCAVLRRDGWHPRELNNGGDLLDALVNLQQQNESGPLPSLIITDHHMPKVFGLDAMAAAQAHPRTRAIPFIVITAFGDASTHARAHALGAATVLDKPFDLQDLLAATAAAVA